MPDNAAVADTFGYLLIQHGEVDRGIALLEKAAKAEPKLADIHYHIAQGWIKKGDKPKARGALERALSINAKFSDSAEAAKQLKQLRE